MTDFRANFYDQYVSRFKGIDAALSRESQSSYFTWCEYKFLPLLEGLRPEAKILDIGCGSGAMLEFLKNQGFNNVQGIDISKEQIDLAIQKGYDAEVQDVFDYLNNKPEMFDAIIALDFIEHFHKEEMLELAQLLFNSLTNGGRLILQTPNGEGLFPRQIIYGDLTHLTIFTPNSLKQLFLKVDFHEFYFYETGPVPKNLTGRVRLLLWKIIKYSANLIRKIESGKSQTIWTENIICYCVKSIS